MFLPNLVSAASVTNTSTPHYIALCFLALDGCCVFYKLKPLPSATKRLQLSLLQVVTKPAVSLRYACTLFPLSAKGLNKMESPGYPVRTFKSHWMNLSGQTFSHLSSKAVSERREYGMKAKALNLAEVRAYLIHHQFF